MRRFEHASTKRFWTINSRGSMISIRWGETGTTGQQRNIDEGGDPKPRMRELIAKQLEQGYVEAISADEIAATILEGARWYKKFVGKERSLAIALEDRRYYEWRDGSTDAVKHQARGFAQAKEAVESLIAAALDLGMVPTDDLEPEVEIDPVLTIRVRVNPELEAQCRAAPDDPAPWSVYADWLMTEQDVRGELAALRVSGKDREADALFTVAAAKLLGKNLEPGGIEVTAYRHGFPHAVTLKVEHDSQAELADVTAHFLAMPYAMFVDELRFGLASYESDNDWTETMKAVCNAPHAQEVRALRFDAYTYEDCEISWTPFGNFSTLWEALPKLEELRLRSGAGGVLGAIVAPALKKFVRVSGGLRQGEIDSIVHAVWPALEHLEVWFGRARYEAEGTGTSFKKLLDSAPPLKHLGIVNCEFVLDALNLLMGARLLAHLKTLDLSNSIMYRLEPRLMIEHAERFAHLESIDVTDNYLEPAVLEELQRALPSVTSRRQREYEDYSEDAEEDEEVEDGRYAALGE